MESHRQIDMLQTVLLYIYIDIDNYIHLKNYLNYRYFRRDKIRLKSQTPTVFFSIWSIISSITFPELRLLKQLHNGWTPDHPTPSSGVRHECSLVLPKAPGSSNRFTIETEWSFFAKGCCLKWVFPPLQLTYMLWRIDSWKIILTFKMVPFLGTSSFSLGYILEIM